MSNLHGWFCFWNEWICKLQKLVCLKYKLKCLCRRCFSFWLKWIFKLHEWFSFLLRRICFWWRIEDWFSSNFELAYNWRHVLLRYYFACTRIQRISKNFHEFQNLKVSDIDDTFFLYEVNFFINLRWKLIFHVTNNSFKSPRKWLENLLLRQFWL
jgi:hypothetical protein